MDLADGRVVRARRLLVTTGLVDELPQVLGMAERGLAGEQIVALEDEPHELPTGPG